MRSTSGFARLYSWWRTNARTPPGVQRLHGPFSLVSIVITAPHRLKRAYRHLRNRRHSAAPRVENSDLRFCDSRITSWISGPRIKISSQRILHVVFSFLLTTIPRRRWLCFNVCENIFRLIVLVNELVTTFIVGWSVRYLLFFASTLPFFQWPCCSFQLYSTWVSPCTMYGSYFAKRFRT